VTIAPPLQHLRTDNVGSMLRPRALLDAFAAREAGSLSDDGLRAAQDDAIRALVAEQERHDLPIVVDGEFRRTQFMESFQDVAGFDTWAQRHAAARRARDLAAAGGELVTAPSALARTPATEPLALRRNLPLEDLRFLQSLTGRPAKITLIGPDRILQAYDGPSSRDVYPDDQGFLDAVVAVERDIVAGLVAEGCAYVHMDAPGYTAYVDPASLARFAERGQDPAETMRRTIAAENAVIAGFEGVTFGIHLCRGNERSHWHREGAYDGIAEELFGSLDHGRLLLEYDTERAGGFEPLRFVRRGTIAVLGIVTTKSGALEDRDALLRRIEEASQFLPVEQLAISPQCGFGSAMEGNVLTEAEQWAKLDLLESVAAEVWGSG
jgi:5-methyltetrahydropteroyltriglutamate--homocysteine methyltransferase